MKSNTIPAKKASFARERGTKSGSRMHNRAPGNFQNRASGHKDECAVCIGTGERVKEEWKEKKMGFYFVRTCSATSRGYIIVLSARGNNMGNVCTRWRSKVRLCAHWVRLFYFGWALRFRLIYGIDMRAVFEILKRHVLNLSLKIGTCLHFVNYSYHCNLSITWKAIVKILFRLCFSDLAVYDFSHCFSRNYLVLSRPCFIM